MQRLEYASHGAMGHSSLSTCHQGKRVAPDLLPAVSPRKSLFQRLEKEETTSQFYQVIVHTVSISELLLAPREIQNLPSPKT